MDGILKKVVMSAACAASIFIGGNKLHAYASNLAQSQDVQRQLATSYSSIFSNAYKLQMPNAEPKDWVGFARLLGYVSDLDTGAIEKDKAKNGGFLLGGETAINENWTVGAFTEFQYTDSKVKEDYMIMSEQDQGGFGSLSEFTDTECSTKSFISGLYGRYEKDKLLVQIAGTFGLHHYKHDGLLGSMIKYAGVEEKGWEGILDANYHGWSFGLAGRAAYDLLQKPDLKFGPLVGLDCSYISNSKHCETEAEYEAPFNHFDIEMNKHIVKSLKSFVGLFASKQFSEISCPIMAYAELGWSCECLRDGNKSSWDVSEDSDGTPQSGPRHFYSEHGYWEYMPRNTLDAKFGAKALFAGDWYCGAALGLNYGSHYYNLFGELSFEKAF